MYLGNIDIQNRDRYAVNYPPPNLAGLGLFGKKRRKRVAAETAARELRIANLEKLLVAQKAPAPIAPAPAPVAPVAAPVAPAPVVNIQTPVPVAQAGLPKWAIPAGIGGALLLVAVIIIPQIKKAK